MTTTEIGRNAEDKVSKFLVSNGYKIVNQNWRTKWCEIDIVAKKKKCIYFVEVKYRINNYWGNGFEAITTKKLNQMKKAATIWMISNNWDGDGQLVAASVDSDNIELIFIDN